MLLENGADRQTDGPRRRFSLTLQHDENLALKAWEHGKLSSDANTSKQ